MAVYTRTTLSPEEVTTIKLKRSSSKKATPACNTVTQQGSYKTILGTFGGVFKWVNVVVFAVLHVLTAWNLAVFPYLEEFPLFVYGM